MRITQTRRHLLQPVGNSCLCVRAEDEVMFAPYILSMNNLVQVLLVVMPTSSRIGVVGPSQEGGAWEEQPAAARSYQAGATKRQSERPKLGLERTCAKIIVFYCLWKKYSVCKDDIRSDLSDWRSCPWASKFAPACSVLHKNILLLQAPLRQSTCWHSP
jgi:hypothetical protein